MSLKSSFFAETVSQDKWSDGLILTQTFSAVYQKPDKIKHNLRILTIFSAFEIELVILDYWTYVKVDYCLLIFWNIFSKDKSGIACNQIA